jgi:uncharacterized membrane protein
MSTPTAVTAESADAARATALALEALVARVLVVGTWLAVGLILVGVLGMLASGIDPLTQAQPVAFDLAAIPADLLALRPEGFLWAGIVTVMALPIGRVVVAGTGFLAAGERRLALVSLLVLLVVGVSIVAALELAA